jgi:hypothetical protein
MYHYAGNEKDEWEGYNLEPKTGLTKSTLAPTLLTILILIFITIRDTPLTLPHLLMHSPDMLPHLILSRSKAASLCPSLGRSTPHTTLEGTKVLNPPIRMHMIVMASKVCLTAKRQIQAIWRRTGEFAAGG